MDNFSSISTRCKTFTYLYRHTPSVITFLRTREGSKRPNARKSKGINARLHLAAWCSIKIARFDMLRRRISSEKKRHRSLLSLASRRIINMPARARAGMRIERREHRFRSMRSYIPASTQHSWLLLPIGTGGDGGGKETLSWQARARALAHCDTCPRR